MIREGGEGERKEGGRKEKGGETFFLFAFRIFGKLFG